MRTAWASRCLLLAAFAAGCASSGDGDSLERRALTADLFPFAEHAARFSVGRGQACTLRVTPDGSDAAVLRFERGNGAVQSLRATRGPTGVHLSAGPSLGTEVLRLGAVPGATWESRQATVRFDGWERVQVPAGAFDAARITTTSGPEDLPWTETWWFAPGEGIVRLRSDRGGIFADEMMLLSR
jgi:hypothetical protein